MVSRPFDPRHGLPEAAGFKVGQRVKMLVETMGADHEDIEHTLPPGTEAIIEGIEMLAVPQGLAFTLWIPVNELEGRGIVNVFDQADGPITSFIEPL